MPGPRGGVFRPNNIFVLSSLLFLLKLGRFLVFPNCTNNIIIFLLTPQKCLSVIWFPFSVLSPLLVTMIHVVPPILFLPVHFSRHRVKLSLTFPCSNDNFPINLAVSKIHPPRSDFDIMIYNEKYTYWSSSSFPGVKLSKPYNMLSSRDVIKILCCNVWSLTLVPGPPISWNFLG